MRLNKFIVLLLVLITVQVFAYSKVIIPLYIPSGVTSDLSQLFNNKIKKFESQNPDIDVVFKPEGSYEGVLKKVLRNSKNKKSSGIAIIELSELPSLVNSNTIIPLNVFLKNEPELLNNILPNFLKNSYDKNKTLYGLPMFRSTPIVYYNMDILEKAGIYKKDLPKNWNELKETLLKIKKVIKKPPLLLAPNWFDWLFESFVIQSGGSLTNKDNTNVQFNHPETIEALMFWKELKDKGLLTRRNGSWKSTINIFSYQKYPVIYYSTAGMGYLQNNTKFNWLTDVMPKNKIFGTTVGASSIFISNYMTKEEEKASWKLLKYLLSDEVQVDMSLYSGYLSVTKSSYKEKRMIKRYSKPPFDKVKEQLSFAKAKIMIQNYSQIREILKRAIDRSLDNNMDPKESLNIAQKEAQQWLN